MNLAKRILRRRVGQVLPLVAGAVLGVAVLWAPIQEDRTASVVRLAVAAQEPASGLEGIRGQETQTDWPPSSAGSSPQVRVDSVGHAVGHAVEAAPAGVAGGNVTLWARILKADADPEKEGGDMRGSRWAR